MLAALHRLDYVGKHVSPGKKGVLLPIVLLAIPNGRPRRLGLVRGGFLAAMRFVMHRLNVGITDMEGAAGVVYFPLWEELAALLALGAYCSHIFTPELGDVIGTGTPGGVGSARKPPRFLKEGDVVVVEVQGIGQLRNPARSEAR